MIYLDIQYKRGKLLFIADALSRDPLPNYENQSFVDIDIDNEIVCHVNSFVDILPISKLKLETFTCESLKDNVHNLLRKTIFNGWPNSKDKLLNELALFWNYREELHVIDDLIFKNNSLLVPATLQTEMLQKIHEGQMSVNFCCNRAKNVLFWPSMQSQIKEMCLSCEACISFSTNNSKEPIICHEKPNLHHG